MMMMTMSARGTIQTPPSVPRRRSRFSSMMIVAGFSFLVTSNIVPVRRRLARLAEALPKPIEKARFSEQPSSLLPLFHLPPGARFPFVNLELLEDHLSIDEHLGDDLMKNVNDFVEFLLQVEGFGDEAFMLCGGAHRLNQSRGLGGDRLFFAVQIVEQHLFRHALRWRFLGCAFGGTVRGGLGALLATLAERLVDGGE